MYKIGKYILDDEQTAIVESNAKNIFVVAGAGSGKTLTILGKIDYLIKNKNYKPEDILCITFTNEAANSLKAKLKRDLSIDIDVFTFHKLGLNILKKYKTFEIADSCLLDDIIYDYFKNDCIYNLKMRKIAIKFFNLANSKEYTKMMEKENYSFKSYLKLFSTFIHLFKSNNYRLNDFLAFSKKCCSILNFKDIKKEKAFLTIALNIYLKYEDYLKENSEIDFDDMLIEGKNCVEKYGYPKIKYIIIDEFQDTSFVRFELIREIIKKTNASFMVVGDDFQSIYRFTGCDLSLFLDFKSYFPNSKIYKIQNTYRNCQELITVAGSFIMKNKMQIRKNLKSSKSILKPIKIIYYENPTTSLIKALNYLNNYKDIMIIGRNNDDIKKFINHNSFKIKDNNLTYKSCSEQKITYYTAHKSKGLERDATIIINMEDSKYGFPCKIVDDRILRFVLNKKASMPFDEERRLFYVALTRSKGEVVILVPRNNPSIFVKELLRNYSSYIETLKKIHLK